MGHETSEQVIQKKKWVGKQLFKEKGCQFQVCSFEILLKQQDHFIFTQAHFVVLIRLCTALETCRLHDNEVLQGKKGKHRF